MSEPREMNVYDLYKTSGHRFHDTIALFYTYRCNIQCGHCSFNCGPSRKEKMDLADAKNLLKAAASSGKRLVSLSGGEIFLYYDELCELVTYCADMGMEVVVDTNGFWGKTPEHAKEKLKPLVDQGLSRILISADTFHQKFIPIRNPFNILQAARYLGTDSGIWFCTSPDKEQDRLFLDELKKETDNIFIIETIPCGAASRPEKEKGLPASEFEPCEGLSVCTLPNGDTFVCCVVSDDNSDIMDTPLYMGNCIKEKPEEVLARKNLFCMDAFFDPDSPIWFKHFFKQEPFKGMWENKAYSHICELCIVLCQFCFCELIKFRSAGIPCTPSHNFKVDRALRWIFAGGEN